MANQPAETPKVEETKAQKFTRLATARVSNVLADLEKVTVLANKNQYEYTTEQVAKITAAISGKVSAMTEAFAEGKAKAEAGFSL